VGFGRFFLDGRRIFYVFLEDILEALHFVLFVYGTIKKRVRKMVSSPVNFEYSQFTLLENNEAMNNKRIFFYFFYFFYELM